jgi:hypothetical protein
VVLTSVTLSFFAEWEPLTVPAGSWTVRMVFTVFGLLEDDDGVRDDDRIATQWWSIPWCSCPWVSIRLAFLRRGNPPLLADAAILRYLLRVIQQSLHDRTVPSGPGGSTQGFLRSDRGTTPADVRLLIRRRQP